MKEYTTISIPKPMADDLKSLIDEIGYWPSLGSFVREACIEKLHMERVRLRILKEEVES